MNKGIIILSVLFFLSVVTTVSFIMDLNKEYTDQTTLQQIIGRIGGQKVITNDWTIEGESVWMEDGKAYIKVTPHTLQSSGWIIINFTSKVYTGDIDIALGFDTTTHKPSKVQRYNPRLEEVTESYVCDGFFNYTLSPNHFWCYDEIIDYNDNISIGGHLELKYDRDFDTGNIGLKTAYWNETVTNYWSDVNKNFPSIDYEYEGMNKWWFAEEVSIVEDQENVYRIWIDDITKSFATPTNKYWVAFKPSGETIQQAIGNNNFYALDPWTAGLSVGLKAYLTLNESTGNSFDDSLGVYNYTASNVADPADHVDALIAKGIFFNGKNTGQLNPNSGTNLTLDYNNGTISFWYNATTASREGYLMGTFNGGNPVGSWRITQDAGTNKVEVTIQSGAGSEQIFSDNVLVFNDNWTHIVLQWGDAGMRMYLNGTLQADTDVSVAPPSFPDWCIGAGRRDGSCSTGVLNPTNGTIDEIGFWNRTLSASEISTLYNNGGGVTFGVANTAPTVTSNIPLNNTNFSTSSVTINCSATDDFKLTNISLYIDGTINQTFSNISADQTYIDIETTEQFAEGSYLWNCISADAEVPANQATGEERNFTIDLTAPVLGATWNITTDVFTYNSPINKTFNYSVSDPHLETCWYNSSDNGTINVVGCNAHTLNASFSVGGIKQIYYYANDTGNLISYANKSFDYQLVEFSQATNKPNTLQGSSAQFNLTINFTAIPSTTATFWYNNSSYSPTTDTFSINQYNSTRTLTIPSDVGNNTGENITWFWEFKIDGVGTLNTSKQGQTITSVEIGNCSFYGTEIVNWTLHDEGTDARVDVLTHNKTEVEIDLTLISITDPSQSWNYFNTWINQSNGTICVPNGVFDSPNELFVDQVTTFRDNGTHVEEFFYLDHRVLSNSTVPQIQIYRDLLALDSTSFITSFENSFGLLQKDVVISVLRFYIGEGTYKEVERAITDNNGETVLHLVEEDVVYIFNVTDNDVEIFTSTEFRVFCEDIVSGTTCRIALDADPAGNDANTQFGEAETKGYDISFNRTTRVITFSFTLNESALMNITVYPYNWNETDIQQAISTNTTTASSGTMTLVLPASYGNKTFLLEVYKGNEFVTSKTISFLEKLSDFIGKGTALFFAGLIFLMLALITLNLGSRAVAASAIVASLLVFGIGLVNSSTTLVPLSILIILMALLIIYVISQRRGRT